MTSQMTNANHVPLDPDVPEAGATRRRVLRTGAAVAAIAATPAVPLAASPLGHQIAQAAATIPDPLLHLEANLSQRIVGQEHVLAAVASALRRWWSEPATLNHLQAPTPDSSLLTHHSSLITRLLGSFLFLGPVHVGKTELAKRVAEFVFGSPDAIIRFPMDHFADPASAATLAASFAANPVQSPAVQPAATAPPLTGRVLLFDEIQDAHPQALTTLAQLLTSREPLPALRGSLAILTSSLPAADLHRTVPPALLDAIGETVTFRPLTPVQLQKVADLMRRTGHLPASLPFER